MPIREPSEPPEAGSDGFSSAIESICLFCFVSLSRSHARAASAWCSLLVRGSRGDRGESDLEEGGRCGGNEQDGAPSKERGIVE